MRVFGQITGKNGSGEVPVKVANNLNVPTRVRGSYIFIKVDQ